MLDKWFKSIKLEISFEQFCQLPRNAAYKYEYWDGVARLTPRPRGADAMLRLADFTADAEPPTLGDSRRVSIRRLRDADWSELPSLCAAAFHLVQPFQSIDDEQALEAARECLGHTRDGGYGPLISQASYVAVAERSEGDEDGSVGEELRGAIILTLWPGKDFRDWHARRWDEPPPPDAVARGVGRPHVTWVFVAPFDVGEGIGTALLAAAVRELRSLGYGELGTSFLVGNHSSMLWHWRNGFALQESPASKRAWRVRHVKEPGSRE